MKKLLLTIFSTSLLFGFSAMEIKLHIISKIAHEVVKKDIVKVSIDDEKFYRHSNFLYNIELIKSAQNADILFLSQEFNYKRFSYKKYIFATSYKLFKKYPDILGVFFWQKGRPNIIIRESVAKKLGISFSKDFEKFLD